MRRIFLTDIKHVLEERFIVIKLDSTVSIGLIKSGDEIIAYNNICPHAGAPICIGKIISQDQIVHSARSSNASCVIICPWHGWEFDLDSGRSIIPHIAKLKKLRIEIFNDKVYLLKNN